MKKIITMLLLTIGLTFGLASVSQAKLNLAAADYQAQSSQLAQDAAVEKWWGWCKWWWCKD